MTTYTNPRASGRKLTVGANKTYSKPSLAFAAAKAGDTIEIDAGDYRGDVLATYTPDLTIKAVVYGYAAYTAGRYPLAASIISGTGLSAPTF